MDHGVIFVTAQNDAHGIVLARLHQVLLGVRQVQAHLASVGMGELADLEVDYYQAAQPAVKKQQVDAIPLISDANALLPGDKGEPGPQLQ